jgi:hypothetical protein
VHYRVVIVCAVLCFGRGVALLAADIDEVDREIARLKKEVNRVQAQRNDEAQQAKKERLEFKKYGERIAERTAAITRQTDSLSAEVRKANLHNDSIRSLLSVVASRIREQELQRQRLREVILRAAHSLESEIARCSPLVGEQYEGPINYLISEIEAGSVDHTEALYRLMRIVGDVRTAAQEVQVVETASPVPQLRGTVYRLRIGSVFEAVVDVQGAKAFIWNGKAENDDDRWIAAALQEDVASIFTAVRIREGKTVPELVRLPFGAPSTPAEERP